ncbi:hypothetical protein JQX13_45220 [Archangium violaceum]|uniref:hypothetical protein n=1 Tax=Archangium violaceum TaxID=83451 RepID=UPI00193B4531|nr:hypothetical protein [Archangium violaceum]QRK07178.1 hypothetical protein JQX13_45220 [Archangium violaceum]
MEIGEAVNVPVAASAELKEWKLRAEILEVTFKGTIKVSRGKTLISPPHWKKGEDVNDVWADAKKMGLPQEAAYSKKAAAMLIHEADGATKDVEVKIKVIEAENVSGEGELLGCLGDMEITAKLPLGVGEHVVKAQIKTLPYRIAWYRGSIEWRVSFADPGGSIVLGGSDVEVFFLPAVPIIPFKTEVWVEVLRFLCNRMGVVGLKTPGEVLEKITRYCHTGHGLEYDTLEGKYHYGDPDAREFRLNGYMKGEDPECCCYDQASAVQVFAAALGVSTEWLFMEPFGYIHTTNLIGVGACNNPFYRSNGTDKIVMPLHPKRTSFGNHAFVRMAGKILDACAGPHVGMEKTREYLDNTIDYDPKRYPYPNWERAGTVDDISIFPPVMSLK